jgi:hypothetical protein
MRLTSFSQEKRNDRIEVTAWSMLFCLVHLPVQYVDYCCSWALVNIVVVGVIVYCWKRRRRQKVGHNQDWSSMISWRRCPVPCQISSRQNISPEYSTLSHAPLPSSSRQLQVRSTYADFTLNTMVHPLFAVWWRYCFTIDAMVDVAAPGVSPVFEEYLRRSTNTLIAILKHSDHIPMLEKIWS